MSSADASQEAMNPDRWTPTIPPAAARPVPSQTRRVDPAEIAATNEDAKAMNAYNARVSAAVNSLLADAARAAIWLTFFGIVVGNGLSLLEQWL